MQDFGYPGKVLFAAFPQFARLVVGFGRDIGGISMNVGRSKGKTLRRHVERS
jgi:hypothetical protein